MSVNVSTVNVSFPVMKEVKGFIHPTTGKIFRQVSSKEAHAAAVKMQAVTEAKPDKLQWFIPADSGADEPAAAATPPAAPPTSAAATTAAAL